MSRGATSRAALTALTTLLATSVGCPGGGPPDPPHEPETLGRCADFDPLRRPLFGDTHVHTARSLDANLQGTRLSPLEAYRFALGDEVGVPPYTAEGEPLRRLRLARPLDFAVLSDHAEFLGSVTACTTPGHPGYDHRSCVNYREAPLVAFVNINSLLNNPPERVVWPALCGPDGLDCADAHRAVWAEIQEAAEAAYDRTDRCSFTTFVGYEWSANPGSYNLHRNVIFRNDVVPDWPVSYFDAPTAEGLWRGLREGCLDAGSGCDVLTIPHNSNLSSGLMFEEVDSEGRPFTEEYVTERRLMEPLIEIFQHKGSSECRPDTNTGDELCSFEALPYTNLAEPVLEIRSTPPEAAFVRGALARGLHYQDTLGANPFQYGFIASTDTHIGAPGATDEAGFLGHGGAGGSTDQSVPPGLPDVVEFNPGGLAVLWAEENSREGLFLAMQRREAYGTSGPRIVLRLFGGWSYPEDMCDAHDFAATGYEGGVPMGGTLPARPSGDGSPVLAVWALADPGVAEAPGTPLERVQVVKGWLDGDDVRIEVFEVAGDPDGGATVDLATCEPVGDGFDSLCAVWTDPSFDSATSAFYYVRVLENPICRWATMQCNAAGVRCDEPATVTEGYEGCCLETWERTIQERAWSSPIWYTAPPDGA